ncbi:O-antigen ligase family protein [Denitromonas iodatirespirans]|uniref:O-antigen ligase family protein n=1 Tax=Denitromonas iodatirespirans TaxID=2795389 RepID=A0A944DEB3_DENI1|nr:O-antigen ligase family protein [Denitromonas iodatirespirans]MBT0962762.1 O-antigen ligase family protein [Denitromonas iodatirespirans]
MPSMMSRPSVRGGDWEAVRSPFVGGKVVNFFVILSFVVLAVVSAVLISMGFFQILIVPLGFVACIFFAAYIGRDQAESKFRRLAILSCLLYIISSIVWPRYVAVWLPGLPSINVQRIAGVLFVAMVLWGAVASRWFRAEVGWSMRSHRVFWIFLMLFVLFRTVSAAGSENVASSAYQLVNEMVVHVIAVLLGVILGSDWRLSKLFMKIVSVGFVVCFFVAIVEFYIGRNVFSSFVDPSNAYVQWALSEKARGGSYRVQSTFGHPLTFAEFASVGAGASIFIASQWKKSLFRWFGGAVFGVMGIAMVIFAGSRAGYGAVAVVASLLVVAPLANAIFRKRLSLTASVGWCFALIAICTALSFTAMLVYDYAFGEKAYSASNSARAIMLERGVAKTMDSPILGYGVGMAADLVGTPSGTGVSNYTVDSLYISYMVDSGFFAVMLFFAMSVSIVFGAFRLAFVGGSDYWLFWFVVGAAVLSMLIFKLVLSLHDNNYILFSLMGLTVARISGSRDEFNRPPATSKPALMA